MRNFSVNEQLLCSRLNSCVICYLGMINQPVWSELVNMLVRSRVNETIRRFFK